jgi:hypothetical protein
MSDPHTPTAGGQPEHERATEHGRLAGDSPAGEHPAGERVAEMVRAVDVRAPQELHRRVREMVASPASSRTGARGGVLAGRVRPTLAAMALAASVGAVLALLTGPGSHRASSGPSVSAASRLTLSAATTGAPGESPAHSAQLNVTVDGVAFPYWGERFGWRASGMRTDTMDGRNVTTVFYSSPHGRRIGYAIVAGTPAPPESGGTVLWHGGTAYRMRRVGGVPVLSWQREGRMCVLAGRGVSAATLMRLASWNEGASAS